MLPTVCSKYFNHLRDIEAIMNDFAEICCEDLYGNRNVGRCKRFLRILKWLKCVVVGLKLSKQLGILIRYVK